MKMSVSFVLGKASGQHSANVDHNNRKFIADNIDGSRTNQNIIYVKEKIEDSYEKLFGKAVDEYNEKQKRADRKIQNYYEHIKSSKREEAFYEAIVQFGDRENANCLSENGTIAKKMLDEYMKNFKKRNPNLYVFNAVMHLDEESPHLHIDFIPFYTKGRERYVTTGVSMRSAMIEQGFIPQGKMNQLVAWEESERKVMEQILNEHHIERENKNAHYKHMTDREYKEHQDFLKAKQNAMSRTDLSPMEQKNLVEEYYQKKRASAKFTSKTKNAEYKSFYFASADKQSFMETELNKLHIPYRETENGLEAQACFVETIREVEKKYKASNKNIREQLRDDLDRCIAFANEPKDAFALMVGMGYEIKFGKYISFKPKDAERFIRMKSLGSEYAEQAIALRIQERKEFDTKLSKMREQAETGNQSEEYLSSVLTIQLYVAEFRNGTIPIRRIDPSKALTWKNDANISALLALNEKLREGATLEQLHKEMEIAEQKKIEKQNLVKQANVNFRGYTDIYEKSKIIFEDQPSTRFTYEDAKRTLEIDYPMITKENYKRMENLCRKEKEELTQYESELAQAESELKDASNLYSMAQDVLEQTYIPKLNITSRFKGLSEEHTNGIFDADLENYRTL